MSLDGLDDGMQFFIPNDSPQMIGLHAGLREKGIWQLTSAHGLVVKLEIVLRERESAEEYKRLYFLKLLALCIICIF